jgi:hypothetical protein
VRAVTRSDSRRDALEDRDGTLAAKVTRISGVDCRNPASIAASGSVRWESGRGGVLSRYDGVSVGEMERRGWEMDQRAGTDGLRIDEKRRGCGENEPIQS